MKTQLLSLSKIFIERILRIPDYQRGYAWTERQLRDFWGDLCQLEENKNHYTGVLTLEEVPEDTIRNWVDDHWIIHAKSYAPYYVVDGQQRLTTSIILIQAITELVPEDKKLNYNSIEEIKKKFIYDSKDDGWSRSYIFGYEKDNPSYEFLKTRIFLEKSNNSFPTQETIYTHNLERAKEFFNAKLQGLDFSEIEIIYRKLTQNLLFNIYSISDDVDVFVAFETMNNRGKPLSHLELLKNRLIYLSTKFDIQSYEKQDLRHAINESWKSIYHYLGKNKNKPLDDDEFLYNHFLLYFRHEIQDGVRIVRSQSNRFIDDEIVSYKDYLLEKKFTAKSIVSNSKSNTNNVLTPKEIYSYVQSIKNSVEVWYQILNPDVSDVSSEEKEWLEKLNRLSIIQVAPLVMVFYQNEKNSKLRIRLLKALERHLFFLTMRKYPYSYGFETPNLFHLSSELAVNKNSSEKVIKEIEQFTDDLVSLQEVINQIIDDFRTMNFYNWRGLKYFLYEYDLFLKSKTKTYREQLKPQAYWEDPRDYSTIEHIYPQRPRKPCWTSKFRLYSDKQKSALRHSLGNLVPLSQPKNSSFQNKCFEDKKGDSSSMIGFNYGSYSEREIAGYSDWTAKEILQRGVKLTEFMEKRWNISFGGREIIVKFLNLEFVVSKEKIDLNSL